MLKADWNLKGALVAAVLFTPVADAAPPIDAQAAARAFSEFERACRMDSGKLWGASLCGPVMLVERETHAFVANARRAEDGGVPVKGLFASALPSDQAPSNTSVEWDGLHFAQVQWPLPEDPKARVSLLAHESLHRLQSEQAWPLAANAGMGGNAHLDSLEGRIALQLEYRALAAALKTAPGPLRQRAMEDALAFRRQRFGRFASAEREERGLEQLEGLAAYTGIAFAGGDAAGRAALALEGLTAQAKAASYVRSFAYATGPAYGLLLDGTSAAQTWRPRARVGQGLDELLAAAASVGGLDGVTLEARAQEYGGAALRADELRRDAEAKVRIAALRAELWVGPVLELPLRDARRQFNPGNLIPLPELGTVYPTLRVEAEWGVLTVTRAALVTADSKQVRVKAPGTTQAPARRVTGDGWSLELAPGWQLTPTTAPGHFTVTRR